MGRFCTQCGSALPDGAKYCPSCAAPVQAILPTPTTASVTPVNHPIPAEKEREVGLLHGVGIFIAPFIFSWFTLRKGYTARAKVLSFGWLAVYLFIFAFGDRITTKKLSTSSIFSDNLSNKSANSSHNEIDLGLVYLKDYKVRKEGFGSVLVVDFVIENHNIHPIKDIKITCTSFGKSGTKIDSNTRTIYDRIHAHDKKTINSINMGMIHSQVATVRCDITDAKEGY